MVDEQQVASRGPMKKDLLAFRSEEETKKKSLKFSKNYLHFQRVKLTILKQ
jgi:hypothetical protein